jgi:PIN domain nuclease of toxin-antitoxin system
VGSCRLLGVFHGNKADRLLGASARLQDVWLKTYDRRMIAYGADQSMSVLTL